MANWKRFFFGSLTLLVTLSLITFVIYFVLANKPVKPQFAIQNINIDKLNISGTIVNSKIKIDLLLINSNRKADINYEAFHIYAAYNNYKITLESNVIPFKQREQKINIYSCLLTGNGVILPASVCDDLSQAHTNGSLSFTITAVGKVRTKIAGWKSSRFNFEVICDRVASFQNSYFNAVSIGLVATLILISIFLLMAIFECFFAQFIEIISKSCLCIFHFTHAVTLSQ